MSEEVINVSQTKTRKAKITKAQATEFLEWLSQDNRVDLKTKAIQEIYKDIPLTANFIRVSKARIKNRNVIEN